MKSSRDTLQPTHAKNRERTNEREEEEEEEKR
jgi:hypothetical protein